MSVCMSVSMSATVIHSAKAVGRSEVPFGRDTRVVPSNTVLDTAQSPLEGEIRGSESPVHNDAAYRQITLAVVAQYNTE